MKIPVGPLRDGEPEEPARATFARSASLSPAARRSWLPPPLSAPPLFAWLRPLKPPSLPGSFSADPPVAPMPPAIHRLVVLSRIVHLRPVVSARSVFARIRLDLCAIDGYLPQLHQSGLLAQ